MKITNRGIITDTLSVKNQEINPDELHYYRFDSIATDQIVMRYDVTKAIQDWGVSMWFSNTPAGSPVGRPIPVTYQTDITLKVVGDTLTMEKGGGYVETLFDIISGLPYYINVHNLQSNDNFYYLVIGPEEPPSDICG